MIDNLFHYLEKFKISEQIDFTDFNTKKTKIRYIDFENEDIPIFINEYWTSKQRKSKSIHEISYRACFKAQLPKFFINLLSKEGDVVFDPFAGRGTTAIEAGLNKRNIISNDVNPISKIYCRPRFFIPSLSDLEKRLSQIPIDYNKKADIDLSMFYHKKTEAELVSLKHYLDERKDKNKEDKLDRWIRMIATSRLTGHSNGFFSVYTLPPNQAISAKRQKKINLKRNQIPTYKKIKPRILKKSKSLIRDLYASDITNLKKAGLKAKFFENDARSLIGISDNTITLTVTSPPFLDIVKYDENNWLRFWFNSIDEKKISAKMTIEKNINKWNKFIDDVFKELFRITKLNGWVAFEVGKIKKGNVKLENYVLKSGINAGFDCKGIMINQQNFTKTSNIWGINNMKSGTNTNRILIFKKKG